MPGRGLCQPEADKHIMMNRRNLFKHTAAALLVLAAQTASAQAWPTKPISMVVPFPPGGTTDVLARAIASRLAPVLGQPVVVESKPGAGATLGAAYVAKAAPDGYTFLIGAIHHTIATSIYKNLSYDFQKDLTPVTMIAFVPNVLVVNVNTPVSSAQELVALSRKSPEKLAYGSAGNGTAQHLIGEQFQIETGTELLHVPYKGSGPLVTDLLGGQIIMSFDTVTPVLPHIKSGKLKPLAVTSGKRSSALPDVPTMKESGINIDIGTWFGVLAPVGTSKEILTRLNTELLKIIASPDFRKQMADIGAEPIGNSPTEFAQQIKADTEKFAVLVKAAKLNID